MRRGGAAAIQEAAAFFMKDDPVYQSLRDIARRLESLGVHYAVAGGMALVAHGYNRTTVDIDVLVTPDGLKTAQESLTGFGYTPPFAGSKNLRDAQTGVQIEFLVSGQFPGDGKPKPISFPDPATVAVEIDGIRYVGLTTLIELKLASGMTHPGRLRDLADVQELIRVLRLPAEYASRLHPYVRDKYVELHAGLQDEGRDAQR
jgi:hypothetical protein